MSLFDCLFICVLQNQQKPEPKLSKTETPASMTTTHGQTDLSVKPDNVKIKGLQANVTIPKVCVCVSVCLFGDERRDCLSAHSALGLT